MKADAKEKRAKVPKIMKIKENEISKKKKKKE